MTPLISSKKRHLIDKTKWPDGPWKDEPDLAEWQDKETGYRCVVYRQPRGYLCGYVGVDKNHPLWNQPYYDMNFLCHGGLTFSGWIENVTQEINTNRSLWFVGFDCDHCRDASPLYKNDFPFVQIYRDFGYAEEEVRGLAKQIKKYHDDMSLG